MNFRAVHAQTFSAGIIHNHERQFVHIMPRQSLSVISFYCRVHGQTLIINLEMIK